MSKVSQINMLDNLQLLSLNLRSFAEGSIMTSSISAKLKLDTLASSFTGTEGAGVDDGGGVVIGAQKQLMAHRATASDSATGVLFIFFVLCCF